MPRMSQPPFPDRWKISEQPVPRRLPAIHNDLNAKRVSRLVMAPGPRSRIVANGPRPFS